MGQKVSFDTKIKLGQIEKELGTLAALEALNDGFKYGDINVLKNNGRNDFDIVKMQWGLLPDTWYRIPIDTKEKAARFRLGYPNISGKMEGGITTLNTMSEEMLLPNKIFRESALIRRCLIPCSYFFEWRHMPGISKKTGQPLKTPNRYPYLIKLKQEYFYLAAIYKPWTDQATGETINTVSIVTTSANSLMKQIHNVKERMPAILPEDLAWKWLFGDLTEDEILELGSYQVASSEMQAYTVVKEIKKALDPTEKQTYPELPELVFS